MNTNEVDVVELLKIIRRDIIHKKESAGMMGARGDNGAGNLEDQIECFNCGREGLIPKMWEKYTIELDPEYQEYKRLKNKFEK